MKKLLFLCVLLPLLTGNGKGDITVLDIDKALTSMKDVKLSSLASSLEYIPLETADNVLLDRTIAVAYIDTNYILVEDSPRQNVFLFKRNGEFISKIGRRGNGPGEISGLVTDTYISPETGYIYLFTNRKQLVYDTSGRFIEERHPVQKVFGEYGKSLYYGGTDRNVVYFTHAFDVDTRRYNVFASDGNGDDRKEIEGDFNVKMDVSYYDDPHIPPTKSFVLTIFFHNDHAVFYDEVSHLISFIRYDGTCETPYVVKNTGRMPSGMSYPIGRITDCDKFLFLGLLSDKSCAVIYFKKSGKLVALPGKSKEIINDIDGGDDFWPSGVTADGKLYTFLPAHRFKETAEASGNKELQGIASGLEDDDNQVLVLATLK